MTWNKMKMKVVFGQWKVLSSSRRQCSAILKKRESWMCSRVMGRWRQHTMEVKAEKYLIRRRCCWALTRWTVNFHLQVELNKYREIKNLHRMGTYWQIWLLQLQLTVECRLHHRRVLRKRAFATWVSAAHLHGRWREAAARLQSACRHRLLQTCFDRWRAELSLRRQKSNCNQSAAPAMSLHFWRAATRGHQALRLRTQNSVKQRVQPESRGSSDIVQPYTLSPSS
ncbi:uncharacterized protein LOC120915859 [Rana temporaria]|uniref:uncharacterized protein LOC120915859 n=1 Tax=Rana temporaria TaxID=8407 RepID=UPI001AADDFBF|nr:uncharacterized protein LOC120915859 [Rana temporaria]